MTRTSPRARGTAATRALAATIHIRMRRILEGVVMPRLSLWLLCHIEQNQASILFSNRGANSHMPENGSHHTGRKLLRSGMTAPTIGAKALFAAVSHALSIGTAGHDRAVSIFPA